MLINVKSYDIVQLKDQDQDDTVEGIEIKEKEAVKDPGLFSRKMKFTEQEEGDQRRHY